MAATEILAVGNTAASATVEVAAGEVVAIGVKIADDANAISSNVRIDVSLADDDEQYWAVGKLTVRNSPLVLSVPGKYKFSRAADGETVGLFRAG